MPRLGKTGKDLTLMTLIQFRKNSTYDTSWTKETIKHQMVNDMSDAKSAYFVYLVQMAASSFPNFALKLENRISVIKNLVFCRYL